MVCSSADVGYASRAEAIADVNACVDTLSASCNVMLSIDVCVASSARSSVFNAFWLFAIWVLTWLLWAYGNNAAANESVVNLLESSSCIASNDDWSAFRAKLLLMDDCVVCEIVKALWANVFAELTSAWVANLLHCEVVRYDDSCVLFALLFN